MQSGARIGAPMCLPASDFLTPSQGRTVALILGLTIVSVYRAKTRSIDADLPLCVR